MNHWHLLAALALAQAFFVGLLLLPVARWAGGRLGLIDQPGLERKLHTTPIPRSGGIAVFLAFWGCLLGDALAAVFVVPQLEWLPENVRTLAANAGGKAMQLAGIGVGAALIFIVGIWDDRSNLSPRFRLAMQFLATVPLLATGVHLQLFLPAPLAMGITVLWVVGLTNSFNFLDNMNGLCSGCAALCALVLALLSAIAREWFLLLTFAMLAGAALAFWQLNFRRGTIFLGDGGSTHFGYLFGATTVLATYYEPGVPTALPVLTPLLVLAVPLFDTATVMWIRLRTGKRLMEGDKNHISHRLVALGFTQREAVLTIYGFTLAVGLAAVPLRYLDWRAGLAQVAAIAILFALMHRIERVSMRRSATR